MSGDSYYPGRRVVVTGGAGFIGSSLVCRLVSLGAEVAVLDALLPRTGANRFNLAGLGARAPLHIHNIGDPEAAIALEGCEVVFNVAGQGNHLLSMRDPSSDLENNCGSHLRFLETCRRLGRPLRLIFASTRQVYGKHERIPIDETHPTHPCDINGINKLAAESHQGLYARLHPLTSTILRLSNVYGPRMSLREDAGAPFLSRFLRAAIDGKPLEVYGDGTQLRDPLYVDDAVDAFVAAGALEGGCGVINVAGDQRLDVAAIAAAVVRAAGSIAPTAVVPFPDDRQPVDVGSTCLDCTKATRLLGWRPKTSLALGLERTVAYSREHRSHYW